MSASDSLPEVARGYRREYRQCECGCVGFYDYVPYSLSTALAVMPCGRDAKFSRTISVGEFDETVAERSL